MRTRTTSGFGVSVLVSIWAVGCGGGSPANNHGDAQSSDTNVADVGGHAGGEAGGAGGGAGARTDGGAGTIGEVGGEVGGETGAGPAALALSDGPTFDFGTRAIGSTTDHTFTVTNTGGAPATALAASGAAGPFAPKGGAFPGTGGTCAATLAAGASCTLVVTFTPTTSGAVGANVGVSYDDGAATQTASVGVKGAGAAPALLVISDDPTYAFGDRVLTTATDHSFTIMNTGGVDATGVAPAALTAPLAYEGGAAPGTGGTCAATLAAGASCTLVVTFTPTTAGETDAMLSVAYDDGLAARAATRPITGQGVGPALLAISDGATFDFGTQGLGGAATHTFTVMNTGGAPAQGLAVGTPLAAPFALQGGGTLAAAGTCAATLAAYASCSVTVVFTPTVAGAANATLSLSYQDGLMAETASRPMTGTGTSHAFLAISDGPTFDFGTRALGVASAHTFTVTNTGAAQAGALAPAALAAPFAFTGGAFPGTAGTCATTLAAGASCAVDVTFTPTTAGAAMAVLHLDYNDGAGAQAATRALAGAGTNLAFLSLSDGPTYVFPTIIDGSVGEHTFTLTNTGLAGASVLTGGALGAPFAFKGGAYPGGGTCGTTLAAGASCTLVATFHPTTPGLASAALLISYNDSVGAAQASVAVQGNGALPALLALSDGPTFDFGTRATGATASHTFTVINVGGLAAASLVPAALAAPFAYAGGAAPGAGGTCAATLAPGTSCTVVVTFAPVASGADAATLQVGYDDGGGAATTSIGVAGTGATPALVTISDGPTFDFGPRAVGVTASHTFTVSNGGGVDATSVSSGALSLGFGYAGGAYPGAGGTCGATLAAGASCAVVLAFSPTGAGPFATTLSLGYDDGVAPATATRALIGAGAAPASLTISDGPTFDFLTRAIGSTTTHAFTVTNGGGVAATALAAGTLTAPFGYAGGAYPGAGGTCTDTLAATATCTFVVAYAPTAPGPLSAAVGLTYSNGVVASAALVGLQGRGAAPAVLAISDGPTFDFTTRAIGSSTDHTFTVTNSGGVPAASVVPTTLSSPFTFKGGGAFPGVGGTCGVSVAAATSCTFVVTFAPAASGMASASVALGYDDGTTGQSASVGLSGTGAAPALLAISDGPTFDYQTHATGSTTDHTFTVTNSGGVAATSLAPGALAASYAFSGAPYPGAAGTCGASLAPGASCTMVVSFVPASGGALPAQLTLAYGDGVTTQVAARGLTGTGAAPALLALSDGPTFDFGLHANGSVRAHTFTLTNTGGVSATSVAGGFLGGAFTYVGGLFPGTGGTCGTSLAPGPGCSIAVAFSPASSGPTSATLTVTYSDGAFGRSTSVSLSGAGTPPALVSISDASTYDFGTVATNGSLTHVFHVENDGGTLAASLAPGTLLAPYGYAGGAYPGTGGTCGATLAAGATCAIVVQFAPTTAATFPGALTLGYDDGATSQTATRAMTGKGTTAAFLAITDFPTANYTAYGLQSDPAVFEFGGTGVGSTISHAFTLTNTGASTALALAGNPLSAPFAYAGGTFPGAGGNCGTSLKAGASCTVVVAFHPTTAAASSFTLTVSYNDGTTGQMLTRPMHGTGTNGPALTIWDFQESSGLPGVDVGPAWAFGVRGIGVTDDHSFYVVNTGGGVAINITAPSPGVGFGYKGGAYPGTNGTCGTTLAAGASCSIDVTFSAVAVGAASGSVVLDYTDSPDTTPSEATRPLEGVGTNLASLEIWANGQPFDTLVYDYGFHATGSSTPHTFQLVNAGAAMATGVSALTPPAPFAYVGGSYPGTGGTCGATLAAATACNLVVTFAPTTGGTATGSLSVAYNDGASAQTANRAVMGEATSFAYLSILNNPSDGGNDGDQSVDPYDFGTSGVPTDHVFAVQNIGAQSATSLAGVVPSAPFTFKGGAFPGAGGTCGATLAVGAQCNIVVTYSGAATASSTWGVSFLDGSGGTAQVFRDVTGTSITTALLQITDCNGCGPSSQPDDFGQVGTASQRVFSVTNVGSQTATMMADGGTLNDGFGYGSGGSYPGPTGTCGATLAPGAQCTIGVVFQPPSSGTHASVLTVSYDDGVSPRTAQQDLTGTGVTTALLSISDFPGGGGGNGGQPFDFGSAGVAIDHTFSVFNGGAQPATALAAGAGLGNGFAFKGGGYPGAGGSCASSLAVGTSCNIVVTFTPTGAGSFASTISLNYGSNGGPVSSNVTRAVQGTGITTALVQITMNGPGSGSIGPFDYGTYGAPTDHTFTVVNTGAVAATVLGDGGTLGGAFGFKGGAYPGTGGGNCGTTLAAGGQCNLVVTFTPSGSGPEASTLTLVYDDGVNASAQASMSVEGTAVSGPLVRIYDFSGPGGLGQPENNAPPYDYGTWGVTSYHTFTLSNDGNALAINLTDGGTLGGAFSYEGGGGYPGSFANCGTSLAAGARCTVNVRFTPSGAGPRASTLTLDYTDVAAVPQPAIVRALTGTATLAALVSISDGPGGCGESCGAFVFPTISVGNTDEQTFFLNNQGAVAAALTDAGTLALPFKYKGGAYPGTGGTCGTSLAAGNSCSLVVDYAPTIATTSSGSLGINYDNGQGSILALARSLSGTATP